MTTTPWVCYGQTVIPQGDVIDNPAPNQNGLVGECTCLPYTVPPNTQLTITALWMEAYPGYSGDSALLPFMGTTATDGTQLVSCTADSGTKCLSGLSLTLPAGAVLGARLVNNQNTGTGGVFSWGMCGNLTA